MPQTDSIRPVTLHRLAGAVGGVLIALFIALSFDLSAIWLFLAGAFGAGLGAALAPLGADAHPPSEELALLPRPAAPEAAPAPVGFSRLCGIVLLSYVAGSLFWRVFTTADEWESPAARLTTIATDLLVIVGLVAIRRHVPKSVLWFALVAGIALLAIRFTDAGWHTGHLRFELPPR